LLEQAINQSGLAVIDVGDNGDIAQFHREYFSGKDVGTPARPITGVAVSDNLCCDAASLDQAEGIWNQNRLRFAV
jgi:hypothetical protein